MVLDFICNIGNFKVKNQDSTTIFNKENASSYDNQRAKLAPIKDALHLCIRMKLSDLPVDARILCVGVGTGAELIYLAQEFPQWNFTAVEPSPEMLKICRQRAEECGIVSRCTFHEGYLDSLPDSNYFDAATSILVSHFIVESEKRSGFFAEIAARLQPGGWLINADLAFDMSTSDYKDILDVWINMHDYADMPTNVDSFGRSVALLPADKVESIIKSSGFDSPVLFFQTLFIHAWFSKVSS